MILYVFFRLLSHDACKPAVPLKGGRGGGSGRPIIQCQGRQSRLWLCSVCSRAGLQPTVIDSCRCSLLQDAAITAVMLEYGDASPDASIAGRGMHAISRIGSLNVGDGKEGRGFAALIEELGHVDAGIIGVRLEPQGLIVPVLHFVAVLHGAWQGFRDGFWAHGSCVLQLPLALVEVHAAQC